MKLYRHLLTVVQMLLYTNTCANIKCVFFFAFREKPATLRRVMKSGFIQRIPHLGRNIFQAVLSHL